MRYEQIQILHNFTANPSEYIKTLACLVSTLRESYDPYKLYTASTKAI